MKYFRRKPPAAGTYTPVVLLILPPVLGWIIFGIVWSMAIVGIILNAIDLKKYKIISKNYLKQYYF